MTGFRKSSYCGNGGCIEVHVGQVDVLVRDTKDPTGPFLVFTHDEWRAHVLAIRHGEHRIPGEEPDVAAETWEDWLHAVRENERLRGLLESVSLYIPDEAPNVRAHVRAALAGQGDTPPAEPVYEFGTVEVEPAPVLAALADDVHKGIAEAGVACRDTSHSTLCFEVAEYLLEVGWQSPAAEPMIPFDRVAADYHLIPKSEVPPLAPPPAEPAPVQLDADAIERAADAAARTHDHWACEWDEIPEYVRDDWRGVARAVAVELGLPTGETQ